MPTAASAHDAVALFTADDRIRAWMDRAGANVYPAVFVGTVVPGACEV